MEHLLDVGPRSLIVAGIISLTAMWLVKRFLNRPRNLPPGPTGLPFLGVTFTLFRTNLDYHRLLFSWVDKYGDIYSFRVGPLNIVVLSSYLVIRDAFQHPHLNDRLQSRFFEEAVGFKNNGIALANGKTWKEQRNFFHTAFRSLGVGEKNYEDTIINEIHQLMGSIEETAGERFDPQNLFSCAASNIICSLVFGTKYTYADSEFQRIRRLIVENFELANAGGLLYFIPLPGISRLPGPFRKTATNFSKILDFITKHIELHQRAFDYDNPRDFIDIYLKRMKDTEQGEENSFNNKNLHASLLDLLVAGTETTTTSLKWAIMYMMAYPEIQSRVQSELDHVIGRDRLPTLGDRKALVYTNAVILECMRKGNVTPFSVPHVAAQDTIVHGYLIPKGSIILGNLSNVINDESRWGAPDDFRPDRFLSEEGTLLKSEELITFGSGRRVCPGEQLARRELFLFFTCLLHRFTFQRHVDSPPLSFEGVLGETRNTGPFETSAIKREY